MKRLLAKVGLSPSVWSKLTKSQRLSLLFLLFILIALPLALFLVSGPVKLFSRASYPITPPITPPVNPTPTAIPVGPGWTFRGQVIEDRLPGGGVAGAEVTLYGKSTATGQAVFLDRYISEAAGGPFKEQGYFRLFTNKYYPYYEVNFVKAPTGYSSPKAKCLIYGAPTCKVISTTRLLWYFGHANTKGSYRGSTFTLTKTSNVYTLEPSEAVVTAPVSLPSSSYGMNVLLKKDGQLVLDQGNVRYTWSAADRTIVGVTPSNICTNGVRPPCPNMHADLKLLKSGTTQVNISAFMGTSRIAITSFRVIVDNSGFYLLEPSEAAITMPVSTPNSGYGVNVLLKLKDRNPPVLLTDQTGVTYQWRVLNPAVLSLVSSGFTTGCPYDLKNPCPNMHADLGGLAPGVSRVEVKALIGNAVIATTSFTVNVVAR